MESRAMFHVHSFGLCIALAMTTLSSLYAQDRAIPFALAPAASDVEMLSDASVMQNSWGFSLAGWFPQTTGAHESANGSIRPERNSNDGSFVFKGWYQSREEFLARVEIGCDRAMNRDELAEHRATLWWIHGLIGMEIAHGVEARIGLGIQHSELLAGYRAFGGLACGCSEREWSYAGVAHLDALLTDGVAARMRLSYAKGRNDVQVAHGDVGVSIDTGQHAAVTMTWREQFIQHDTDMWVHHGGPTMGIEVSW